MPTPTRFATPRTLALVGLMALAACGGTAAPSGADGSANATQPQATATVDPMARQAYTDAMCPIFERILAIDPRIGRVRTVAADGGDLEAQAGEMESLSEAILPIVTDLEAVPDWEHGRALRHQLLTPLHAIRATFLQVARDPSAPDAAAAIAAMPFIATDALDRAMNSAREAGMRCAAPG